MSPIARALSREDIADVAAYFTGLETPYLPLAVANQDLIKKGKQLAEAGNPAKGVPGCDACHAAGGAGQPPTIPYLAGQYASYTTLQLRMWQRGFRKNSPEAMALFARKLDEQEIAAVAAYYQQARGATTPAASKQ